MEETKPAPRPQETNPIVAPEYMPLEENYLQSGLGVIPGETEREMVELEDDGLIAGRGCVP